MADTTLYSTIEATVKSFVSSYTDAVELRDGSILSRALTPDCRRELVPGSMFRSLKIPFDPKMDNDAYEKHVSKELVVLEYSKTEILDCSIDTVGVKAAARSVHTLKLKEGDAYVVEFCWFLHFTGDGSKIKKITQFVDATGGSAFLAAMKEVVSKEPKTE